MDQTLIIFGCIALGAVAVLSVTVAVVAVRASKDLERITGTMEAMGNDVAELRAKAVPMLEEATSVLQRADEAMVRIDAGLAQISKGTEVYASIANDVRDLERDLLGKVREPLEDLTALLGGALKGITSFARNLLDR